jgi:hypothetical protein
VTRLQLTNATREHALGVTGVGLGVAMVVLGNTIPSLAFMADSGNILAAMGFIASLYKHETKKAAAEVKEALPGVVESSVSRGMADEMLAVTSAVVRMGTAVHAMQENVNEKHEANSSLFAHLATELEKNEARHAEHVAVTDSHGAAIDALGEAVTNLKPDFTLPPLHQRKGAA